MSVKFTSGREENPAPVFQNHRQKTVLRGSDVEIVYDEQCIIFQRTEKPVVLPETFFFPIFRQIVGKIHVCDSLM